MERGQTYPFDLGAWTRRCGCGEKAQTWLDRGLLWCFAFNHEEAALCLARAVAEDPACTVAHLMLAHVSAHNYNKGFADFTLPELRTACVRARTGLTVAAALAAAGTATPVEQQLVAAMQVRWAPVLGEKGDCFCDTPRAEDLDAAAPAYAAAMARVHAAFPLDADVALLYAESKMNLHPWSMWDIVHNKPTEGADTLAVKEVLERALQRHPSHPGLLHFHIHLMEMSPTPEAALPSGDALLPLCPDAGHLRHMPSHVDFLCGRYREAYARNSLAVAADAKFVAARSETNFYALYRAHNHHFRVFGAMFLGDSEAAVEASNALRDSLSERVLRCDALADWLESFVGVRLHVWVRFGMWEKILQDPAPEDSVLYAATTALRHYARAIAHAVLGDIAAATQERDALVAAAARVPTTRTLFNNTVADILAVAVAMVDGEVAYRVGRLAEAWAALREAVRLSDTLPYDEPWGWMQPPRHALGALLLESGDAAGAASVFAADLGLDGGSLPRAHQHPNNIWALVGLQGALEALEALGALGALGEWADADLLTDVRARVHAARAAGADESIVAACFCATKTCQSAR